MTVREYAEKITAGLILKGYKNVKIEDIFPCECSRAGYGWEPFSRKRVSEDSLISPRRQLADGEKTPGALIFIRYIKPRCRKETQDSFTVQLAS